MYMYMFVCVYIYIYIHTYPACRLAGCRDAAIHRPPTGGGSEKGGPTKKSLKSSVHFRVLAFQGSIAIKTSGMLVANSCASLRITHVMC